MTIPTHEYSFWWYNKNGNTTSIRGTGYDTQEEANAAMRYTAAGFGYKPPRWWEYWRRQEPRLPKLEPPTP